VGICRQNNGGRLPDLPISPESCHLAVSLPSRRSATFAGSLPSRRSATFTGSLPARRSADPMELSI
jgi:hypothetical protein